MEGLLDEESKTQRAEEEEEQYYETKKKKKKGRRGKKGRKKKSQACDEDYDEDPDIRTRNEIGQESRRLMESRYKQREKVKQELIQERSSYRLKMQHRRMKKQEDWKNKMERSPFLVNLIAETERIEEENRMRLRGLKKRETTAEARKSKIKNDIILKAIQEASDLEALRAEKRLIMEEEKRLKALIEVEKTNLNRKQDLMAAMAAEKQRKQLKLEFRRQKRMQFEKDMQMQKTQALKEKLGLA